MRRTKEGRGRRENEGMKRRRGPYTLLRCILVLLAWRFRNIVRKFARDYLGSTH
jgi:hypothetical protein